MKKHFLSHLVLFLFLCTANLLAASPQEIFKKFRPMLCRVTFFKNVSSQSQIGSYIKIKQHRIGLLVNANGLVMVNSDIYPLSLDIISGDGASFYSGEPTDFKITLSDKKEYEAEFVGKDDMAQVAFVQIKSDPQTTFPFIRFLPASAIEIGSAVYMLELLGENYHFESLLTPAIINAIISTPRRKFLIKNDTPALSAGGLVISSSGEALGITLRTDFSYNFMANSEFDDYSHKFLEIAPTEWFNTLIDNPPILKKSVYQGKSWFGIGMQALTPALKAYWKVPAKGGILLNRIYPNSPAARAKLLVGDIIIQFDKKNIDIQRDENLESFREMITQKLPGSTVKIKIFRNGKTKSRNVKLAAAPRAIDLAEKLQLSELGIEVRELTLDILYNNNFPLSTQGVYIYQVDRASPAGLAGLEPGSILIGINKKKIADLSSFERSITNLLTGNSKKIMLRVQRSLDTEFVFVDIK